MKKIFVGVLLSTLILSSCKKDDVESPGNIQGMGNTPGELAVKETFVLPDGISIYGDIEGINSSASKSNEGKSAKDGLHYTHFGSGSGMVRVMITLLNSSDRPRTIFLPRGLLWRCNVSGYQHAILLQTTWISLSSNSQRTILLDLYCINYGYNYSDAGSTYQILGITNSRVINVLLNLIGRRKINYEMIFGSFPGVKGVTPEQTYEQITERLQTIVWNLTNKGTDITDEDKAFLNSIPELNSSEFPFDESTGYPVYFDEFVVE